MNANNQRSKRANLFYLLIFFACSDADRGRLDGCLIAPQTAATETASLKNDRYAPETVMRKKAPLYRAALFYFPGINPKNRSRFPPNT